MLPFKKKPPMKKPDLKNISAVLNKQKSRSRSISCNKSKEKIKNKTNTAEEPKNKDNKLLHNSSSTQIKQTQKSKKNNNNTINESLKINHNSISPSKKKGNRTNKSTSFINNKEPIQNIQSNYESVKTTTIQMKKRMPVSNLMTNNLKSAKTNNSIKVPNTKKAKSKSKQLIPHSSSETLPVKIKKLNNKINHNLVNQKNYSTINLEKCYYSNNNPVQNSQNVINKHETGFFSNRNVIASDYKTKSNDFTKMYHNQYQLSPLEPNTTQQTMNTKKQKKKKIISAAIKIQKVWRGYKTRKNLCQSMIQQQSRFMKKFLKKHREEKKLQNTPKNYKTERNQIFKAILRKNRSPKQKLYQNIKLRNQKYHVYKNQQQLIENLNQEQKHIEIPPYLKRLMPTKNTPENEEKNLSFNTVKILSQEDINKNLTDDLSDIKITARKQYINFGFNENQQQNQELVTFGLEHSDQEDEQTIHTRVYKHQKPVYSYSDIHEYLEEYKNNPNFDEESDDTNNMELQESEKQQQQNLNNEENFPVIIQSNEEYVQSRKTSDLNKLKQQKSYQQQQLQDQQTINHFYKKQKRIFKIIPSENIKSQTTPHDSLNIQKVQQEKQYMKNRIAQIKNQQIGKWNQMIQFINTHIDNLDEYGSKIMKQLVIESENNKNLLQREEQLKARNNNKQKNQDHQRDEIQQFSSEPEGQNQQLSNNSMVEIYNQKFHHVNYTRDQIKQILLSKSLNIFPNCNLNELIQTREEILQQRKILQYKNLNNLLQAKEIELSQYEDKKQKLIQETQNEKLEIERAKRQIQKGMKVAIKFVAKTQRDAQILGQKYLGFSNSDESLKKLRINIINMSSFQKMVKEKQSNNINQQNVFVDEVAKYGTIKSEKLKKIYTFFRKDKKQRSEKYLKAMLNNKQQNYLQQYQNLKTITQNIKKYSRQDLLNDIQTPEPNTLNTNKQSSQTLLLTTKQQKIKFEQIKIRYYNEFLEETLDHILQKLMLQAFIEIYYKRNIFETLRIKFLILETELPSVLQQYILEFVNSIEKNLPKQTELLKRLNQKILPTPFELLKCMRMTFLDSQQEQFQQDQPSKYQLIISQQVYKKAIQEIYSKYIDQCEYELTVTKNLIKQSDVSEQMKKYIELKENLQSLHKEEKLRKKKEVFHITMNCVFDAWNEQIILTRSQFYGFSGIGLNQCTMSLKNYNKSITLQQVSQHINKSKQKLLDIINENSECQMRINNMAYEQICSNQESWICYSDEALGYFLEVDYIINEYLIAEVVNFLVRKMKKKHSGDLLKTISTTPSVDNTFSL